ncbi:MAG TPA: iron chelate uptake ABC transporter family permease subunit [Actinophytocola sp.]|uniref:FecCD family ABC transporter permease n=1 Tax=Actinophytocola sp. TaxID=1872138 RepID=UPI002DB7C70C|nr:iron chelate uptake ABC transporter family permease subunit [Actinophytocola sp.]HEU5475888.1 iron chelate uptake ABC transporter family permease subunit [Actinophytocola sp.]
MATDTRPAAVRSRSALARGVGLLVALGVLAVVALASVAVGTKGMSLASVWEALWTNDGSSNAIIIHDLRIPRTLLGILVGAALGAAGALMQALTRNPLADPGLLGVSQGAAAAVVIGIAYGGITSMGGYIWLAFLGAGVASVVVYALGSTGAAASPERLVLAGAAISFSLSAMIYVVLNLDPRAFDEFRFWEVGSLAGRKAPVVEQVASFILAGLVVTVLLARPLNALALGEETGRALGAGVGRTRAAGILAVTVLCGAATAGAGPIAFVGLTVPHVARMITGPDHRWVLPYAMVLAAILLLGADIVGRVVVAPAELQAGIVTAFLGAPFFIALCRRRRIAAP